MGLTEKQIQVAVNWWAKIIQKPKFDNGDKSEAGIIGMGMASLLVKEVNQEQTEKFKIELAQKLRSNERSRYQGLHTDYAPCQMLEEAMLSAGVNIDNAPYKTNMNFKDDGTVWVSYGYGAEWVELNED